jgi:hypothetical protein
MQELWTCGFLVKYKRDVMTPARHVYDVLEMVRELFHVLTQKEILVYNEQQGVEKHITPTWLPPSGSMHEIVP